MRRQSAPSTSSIAILASLATLGLSRASAAQAGDARRPLPNYDGRAPPPPSVGEALQWVPRVALAPLYVLAEYGVRAPIGWTTREAFRAGLPFYVSNLMHPLPGLAVYPTLLIDFGLFTSVGVRLAWRDTLAAGNTLRLRAATAGPGFWLLSLGDTFTFARRATLGVMGGYLERSDWHFYGLGPLSRHDQGVSFNWARADVHLFADFNTLEHAGFTLSLGARHDRFGEPRIPATLQRPAPPGYEDNGAFYGTVRAFVDTRRREFPNTTGARLEAAARYNHDTESTERRWVNHETEAAAFLEVLRPGRVLGLRVYAAFAHALGSEPVPFADLPTLGGFETMRGWFTGRFRGESALVFTLSYRYPVAPFIDGNVYLEAGNAFGPALAGFDLRSLHGSVGIGFRTRGDRDVSFDVILAVGTTRFDEPFGIERVRLAVGLNRGF